jgi:hypothetical protein
MERYCFRRGRLSVDGANVATLVNKARAHSTVLLVVRDSNGAVFGALITEHLKMGEREKYYGNGTTAVWAMSGDAVKVSVVITAQHVHHCARGRCSPRFIALTLPSVLPFPCSPAQYYTWSFRNSYFLITSKESLAVGGGGNFAIYLVGAPHFLCPLYVHAPR